MIIRQERQLFEDRADAGRQLAAKLAHYRGNHTVVLAIPRGGVPVAVEVPIVWAHPWISLSSARFPFRRSRKPATVQ